jgi:hypothetical protein
MKIVHVRTGVTLQAGSAAFPEHGLILEVLVGRARTGCWPAPAAGNETPSLLEMPAVRAARSAEECC